MTTETPFKKGDKVQFKAEHRARHSATVYTFKWFYTYPNLMAFASRSYEEANCAPYSILVSPDMLELA